MVVAVGPAVEVVASVMVGLMIEERDSSLVETLDYVGCCSCAGSSFAAADSSVALVACRQMREEMAFVLVSEDLVRF
jgi:hypothetical protein